MTQPSACPHCGAAAPEGWQVDRPCPRCLLQSNAPPDEGSAASTGRFANPYEAPQPAELAPFFPQLEVKEFLGQGGMGAVYKARQVKLDRWVALKVFPKEMGEDPAFADRFQREAKALARLHHPNIISVFDFGESSGLYFLLLEYVEGANLRQVLESGKLSPQEALRIVPQICEALQYAHDEGVVHRDIKPENVLMDIKGRVKIADFGLAKLLRRTPGDTVLTKTQQVMGTQGYMAPEQVEKPLEVDHRADIYSLGVVFYEMLTGELPMGRFDPPSRKVQVDVRLDEVVLRALEKEPKRRFQKAGELKTEVENIASKGHAASPNLSPGAEGASWKDFRASWGKYIRHVAAAPAVASPAAPKVGSSSAESGEIRKASMNDNQFIVQRMGGEDGPFSIPDLQMMVRSGRLKANTLLRRSSGGHWFSAREIPGLFSSKEWLVALLLSIFLGSLGIDRFYLGQIGLGIVKLITCGGFGVWYIIDIILIALGRVSDEEGLPLTR